MRYNAEVAGKLNCHGRWHYAGAVARGQLMPSRDDARPKRPAQDSRTGRSDVDEHRGERRLRSIKAIQNLRRPEQLVACCKNRQPFGLSSDALPTCEQLLSTRQTTLTALPLLSNTRDQAVLKLRY